PLSFSYLSLSFSQALILFFNLTLHKTHSQSLILTILHQFASPPLSPPPLSPPPSRFSHNDNLLFLWVSSSVFHRRDGISTIMEALC
ncbi:Protein kinase C-like, partial [Bienertia sinuspersici]